MTKKKCEVEAAWARWLDSDEGEGCNNPDTIQLATLYYSDLTARLKKAFAAGYVSGQEQAEASAPLFHLTSSAP